MRSGAVLLQGGKSARAIKAALKAKVAVRAPSPARALARSGARSSRSGGQTIDMTKKGKSLTRTLQRLGIRVGGRTGGKAGRGLGKGMTATGDFIAKGAKGTGIRSGWKGAKSARKVQGSGSAITAFKRKKYGQLAGAVGRTGAVYGGGAAVVGGTAYGVRKKMKEDLLSPLEREALQEAITEVLLELQ